jgi:hypothetical protein
MSHLLPESHEFVSGFFKSKIIFLLTIFYYYKLLGGDSQNGYSPFSSASIPPTQQQQQKKYIFSNAAVSACEQRTVEESFGQACSSQSQQSAFDSDIIKVEGYDVDEETYVGRHRDDYLVIGLSCNEIDPALVGMYLKRDKCFEKYEKFTVL